MKIKLLAILSVAGLLTSCANSPSDSSSQRSSAAPSPITSETSVASSEDDARIREVYTLYLASGGTLSYEEWLKTVKGEPGASLLTGNGAPGANLGKDGDSYIDVLAWDFYAKTGGAWVKRGNIHGEKGSDGQNGKDGKDGADGQNGKSAYEIYIEAHPEYTGDEQQWLDDLINGRLGNEEKKTYTVTFDLGYDGLTFTQSVEEGKKASKPETPKRNGYNFLDWVDENKDHWVFNGFSITSDITLYAVWSDPIEYQVAFLNNDGSELGVQTAHYGDPIEYEGDVPIAADQDPHYIYTFTGWDKELFVTGDTTLTAQYKAEYVATTAYYYDFDGKTLLSEVPLKEGEEPHFDGESPTRADDFEKHLQFQFSGWNKTGETKDTIVFTAEYEQCTSDMDIDGDKVVFFHGNATEILIPKKWNGKSITSIDSSAFKNSDKITKVTIPDTVKSIGSYAFEGCSSLCDISLPVGLTQLGSWAFHKCSSLTNLSVPQGIEYLWEGVFSSCKSLAVVQLPNTLRSIQQGVFCGCSSLQTIDLPESLEDIGMNGFSDSGLTSIFIPKSVQYIGLWAFAGCNQLTIFLESEYVGKDWDNNWNSSSRPIIYGATREQTSAKISFAAHCYYSVSTVGGVASAVYVAPYGQVEAIDIPSEIDGLPVSAIYLNTLGGVSSTLLSIKTPNGVPIKAINCGQCKVLQSIYFGDGALDSIPFGTFAGCHALNKARLPSGLKKIEQDAFNGTGLKLIYIPDSVEVIEPYSFFNNKELFDVYYGSEKTLELLTRQCFDREASFYGGYEESNCPYDTVVDGIRYRVDPKNEETFLMGPISTDVTSYSPVELDYPITAVRETAFYNCTSLQTVYLPEGVRTINGYAFYQCSSLSDMVLPQSLSVIHKAAFWNIQRLKHIFYAGTSEQWEKIDDSEDVGSSFLQSPVYFFSDEAPLSEGNYWHYVDGKPTVW